MKDFKYFIGFFWLASLSILASDLPIGSNQLSFDYWWEKEPIFLLVSGQSNADGSSDIPKNISNFQYRLYSEVLRFKS